MKSTEKGDMKNIILFLAKSKKSLNFAA